MVYYTKVKVKYHPLTFFDERKAKFSYSDYNSYKSDQMVKIISDLPNCFSITREISSDCNESALHHIYFSSSFDIEVFSELAWTREINLFLLANTDIDKLISFYQTFFKDNRSIFAMDGSDIKLTIKTTGVLYKDNLFAYIMVLLHILKSAIDSDYDFNETVENLIRIDKPFSAYILYYANKSKSDDVRKIFWNNFITTSIHVESNICDIKVFSTKTLKDIKEFLTKYTRFKNQFTYNVNRLLED